MDKEKDYLKPEYYENRELSWLKFNHRVLNEARDKNIPLLERLKLEIAAREGVLRDADYGAEVTLHAAFSQEGAAAFAARLTELSAGQLEMVPAGEEYLPGPREE